MKTRIKRTGPVLKNRAEMEQIVSEIRSLKIAERKIVADRDAAIQEIDDACAPHLGQVAKDIEQRVALCQAWAEANPQEFGDRKSIETAHGVIGFRTGTPKLALLSRWKWAGVLSALKDRWSKFIRVSEAIDKEAIIAAHTQGKLSNNVLMECGCMVTQDESFFVEPTITEVETREVKEAA